METEAYGDVLLNGRPDRADSFKACRSEAPPLPDDLDVIRVAVLNGDKKRVVGRFRHGQRNVDPKNRNESKKLRYPIKIHHRTVFKDVGQPLLHVESLKDVFDSLLDLLNGMQLMHQHGWVHRDISYGNVLRMNITPSSTDERMTSTKITDLEYSKEVAKNTTHKGVRTGTPYFMALEVDEVRYIFNAKQQSGTGQKLSRSEFMLKRKRESKQKTHQAASGVSTLPGPSEGRTDDNSRIWFRHNPLHDMESIAWLALYLVVISDFEIDFRYDGSTKWSKEEFAAFMKAQHRLAWSAFCKASFRSFVLTAPGYLAGFTEGLHPTVASIVQILDNVFSILTAAYIEAEKLVRPGVDNVLETNCIEVSQQICAEMDKILDLLRSRNLVLVKDPSARRHMPKEIDRPAEDQDEDQPGGRSQTLDAADDDDQDDNDGSPMARRSKIPRLSRAGDAGSSATRSQQRLEALATRVEEASLKDDPESDGPKV